jgi:hypothetical protein
MCIFSFIRCGVYVFNAFFFQPLQYLLISIYRFYNFHRTYFNFFSVRLANECFKLAIIKYKGKVGIAQWKSIKL